MSGRFHDGSPQEEDVAVTDPAPQGTVEGRSAFDRPLLDL
jgi:hypothetical protein